VPLAAATARVTSWIGVAAPNSAPATPGISAASGTTMRPAGGGHPPILIVATRGERLGPFEQDLLAAMPDAVIVAFDEDGRSIAKYELWPRRSALGELSVEAIAAAVSTASSWDERFRD